MNRNDDFLPPEPFSSLPEELQAQYHLQRRLLVEQSRVRSLRATRKRRAQERTAHDAAYSSDSDAENADQFKMGPTPDSSTTQELVKLDPAEIGMTSASKYLYSGKEDKHGRFQWTTEIPQDLGKPAEDAESERLAIVARFVKVYNDPKKVLSLHSIVIQSPLIKDLLKEILADYPGVTVGLKRLEFSGRFEPLVHRWLKFQDAIAKLKEVDDPSSAKKLEHAQLLHDLFEKEFKDTIDWAVDMQNQGVMTYELLWTIFQPGSFIYSKQQNQDRVFRLHSSKYGTDRNGNPVFWLICQYVDYDGTKFGMNKININIPAYEGTRAITGLPSLPFMFHAKQEEMKAKLIERGTKVVSFTGSHYQAYNGVGWRLTAMGTKELHTVKGRIIIDTYGWNRFNPNGLVFVSPLHTKENTTANGVAEDAGGGDDDGEHVYEDMEDGMPVDGYFAEENEEEDKRVTLTDEQKLICSPLVRGYALREKMWLNFFVNAVQDVTFSDKAFESLVLPEKHKELILGFAKTQNNYRSQFDDVVAGKGRGIILLLCGPPGVGKTLTAESVAEEMKVPLYMMSAGDLGLDPRHVESKLQGILDMCTRWNAILLLDEADVFLEARNLHELERNKLVTIFLRVLEYYEGIMFLTTNRVQTLDPAFGSRIHISIKYPELEADSRKIVWQNFLKQHDIAQAAMRDSPLKPLASAAKISQTADPMTAKEEKEEKELHMRRTLPHTMTEGEIDKLSLLNINGRNIKNILKTAQLLASKREEGLSYNHITTVMEITQHLVNENKESENVRASFFS